MIMDDWEPTILAFYCNGCICGAADLSSMNRFQYAPTICVVNTVTEAIRALGPSCRMVKQPSFGSFDEEGNCPQ